MYTSAVLRLFGLFLSPLIVVVHREMPRVTSQGPRFPEVFCVWNTTRVFGIFEELWLSTALSIGYIGYSNLLACGPERGAYVDQIYIDPGRNSTRINGNFRILNCRYLPYIRPWHKETNLPRPWHGRSVRWVNKNHPIDAAQVCPIEKPCPTGGGARRCSGDIASVFFHRSS